MFHAQKMFYFFKIWFWLLSHETSLPCKLIFSKRPSHCDENIVTSREMCWETCLKLKERLMRHVSCSMGCLKHWYKWGYVPSLTSLSILGWAGSTSAVSMLQLRKQPLRSGKGLGVPVSSSWNRSSVLVNLLWAQGKWWLQWSQGGAWAPSSVLWGPCCRSLWE